MVGNAIQELNFATEKELREKCIERVDVLNKVKTLFLIPKINMMTMAQVAEYYEVSKQTIDSCYNYNKNEIHIDGVIVKPYKDFSNLGFQVLKTGKGKIIFQIG